MKKKLFINSLPKSGTNLLQKLVELIGFNYSKKSLAASSLMGKHKFIKFFIRSGMFSEFGVNIGLDYDVCVSNKWLKKQINIKEGYYLSGHAAYSEYLYNLLIENDLKTLYIIRDPRDVIISSIYYTKNNKKHLLYNECKNLRFKEMFYLYLYGGKIGKYYINSYREILSRTIKWFNKKNVLVIKFEDIIGSQGGGNDEKQLLVLSEIKKFLDIDFDVDDIQNNLYGKSKTFRKGKIFQWKEELDNDLLTSINTFLLEHIRYMGYKV